MTRNRLKYLRNETIEDLTAQRIREYEAKAGLTVKLPVPVEEIVEQVLGLDFDWDMIEEQPGEQILGGLEAALSYSARTNYCDNHLLGDVPKSLADFRSFYEARSDALRSRIIHLFSATDAERSRE